jgi:hypothetical protein
MVVFERIIINMNINEWQKIREIKINGIIFRMEKKL